MGRILPQALERHGGVLTGRVDAHNFGEGLTRLAEVAPGGQRHPDHEPGVLELRVDPHGLPPGPHRIARAIQAQVRVSQLARQRRIVRFELPSALEVRNRLGEFSLCHE